MQLVVANNYHRNINIARTSFKGSHSYEERYNFTEEICKLIDDGKYGELQSKMLLMNEIKLVPRYLHVYTKHYNTETQNIYGFLAQKYMELKDNYFNKRENERGVLLAIAEYLTKLDDFDPNAKINNKSNFSILDHCIDIKNDKFAKLLVNSKNFNNNFYSISCISTHSASMPETTQIIFAKYLQLIDEINDKSKESEMSSTSTHKSSKKDNISVLLRNKVTPSKYSPQNLEEVGGMYEAKKAVNDFIIKPWSKNYRPQIIENNIQMPNGFLLYGPPGCGKTYLAQAISQELGLPLYLIDFSSLGSSLGYETQGNLNKFFKELESEYKKTGKPQVVMLDELDSICGKRSQMHTDWKRDDVNAVLKLLNNASEKGIIVLGATNFIDMLDPAVLRTGRFDKKIEVSLPTKDERIDILVKMLRNKPIAKNLINKIPQIAQLTENKTCSDINAIMQAAMRNAIFDNRPLANMDDVQNAIKALEFEKDKTKRNIGFYN